MCVYGGRVRWCSCPSRTLLYSSPFPSVSASCKTSHWMPVQPLHPDTSWHSFTEASPWPLLQHSSRDVTFSSTASSYWSSCSPRRRCSSAAHSNKVAVNWRARVWTGASPTVLGSRCRLLKSLELDIKRNKRANRVRFLCLIRKRLLPERVCITQRQWWIHLSALRIALRIYSWQLDWGDGRAGERVGSWIRVTQPPSLYSISGN